ncbi:hypothetical protein D3C86_1455440 [compost metagenome]
MPGEIRHQIFAHQFYRTLGRFWRKPGNVGREDHVVQAFQRIRHLRFVIEDIQCGAGDPTLLQCRHQVSRDDHAGPGDVDDETLRPKRVEHLSVDQVFGADPARRGDDQKIRGARQFGGRRAEGVRQVAAMLAVVVAHVHVKTGIGAFGNGHADRTKAENAQAFAGQRRAHDLWPFTPAYGRIAARNIAHQRQQQRHGVVSHRRGVDAGTVGHGDVTVGRGVQVDVFIASTDHANDLEDGQGGNFIGI